MTIVATTETRNSQWANDPNSFGRKMLSKLGWKEGSGLGKNQQGSSTHLRAVKRSESLGIGAESDAFGDKGWQDTNAGFHGVLANLKREYSSGIQDDNDEDVDEATKKKRRKEEKKRKKKIEKRRAKQQLLKNSESGNSSSGSGSDTNNNKKEGIRLPQNKVQAGHARKMREAKDISNKSSADMAAIFGVKADFYKQPKNWIEGDDDKDTPSKDEISNDKKSKKSKSKKSSKSKRKRSSSDEAAESDTSDSSRKKKRKKSKSKK